MKFYRMDYFDISSRVVIEELNLSKSGVIAELNGAAETDNGHEVGGTQVSYFATKREAEDWARRLIVTRGNAWLIDEELSE